MSKAVILIAGDDRAGGAQRRLRLSPRRALLHRRGQASEVGHADQGSITSLLARAMSEITSGPLTVLLFPSAVAAVRHLG